MLKISYMMNGKPVSESDHCETYHDMRHNPLMEQHHMYTKTYKSVNGCEIERETRIVDLFKKKGEIAVILLKVIKEVF